MALSALHHAYHEWIGEADLWQKPLSEFLADRREHLPADFDMKQHIDEFESWGDLAPYRDQFLGICQGITLR